MTPNRSRLRRIVGGTFAVLAIAGVGASTSSVVSVSAQTPTHSVGTAGWSGHSIAMGWSGH